MSFLSFLRTSSCSCLDCPSGPMRRTSKPRLSHPGLLVSPFISCQHTSRMDIPVYVIWISAGNHDCFRSGLNHTTHFYYRSPGYQHCHRCSLHVADQCSLQNRCTSRVRSRSTAIFLLSSSISLRTDIFIPHSRTLYDL